MPSIAKSENDAGAVPAMQFAGGMSIARIAVEWERDPAWVEEAIRRALLESIPRRDGGLKASRAEVRAERSGEAHANRVAQGALQWPER